MARAGGADAAEPLRGREELRRLVGDERPGGTLFERPIGEAVDERFADDTVRGVVLTDALIGTFADAARPGPAREPLLPLPRDRRRHRRLERAGRRHGRGHRGARGRRPRGRRRDPHRRRGRSPSTRRRRGRRFRDAGGRAHGPRRGTSWPTRRPPCSPACWASRRAGAAPRAPSSRSTWCSSRLPRLRDAAVDPARGVRRHVPHQRGRDQLAAAPTREAAAGRIPALPPAEVYCHSLTDPSILGPDLRAAGAQTLTLFGLHMPARLFRDDPAGAREAALGATLASLDTRAGRADRGLPAARPPTAALPGGEDPGRPGERGGPARRPHLPPRPVLAVRRGRRGRPWGVETGTRASCSAARAPGGAAGSAASPATTRPWRS